MCKSGSYKLLDESGGNDKSICHTTPDDQTTILIEHQHTYNREDVSKRNVVKRRKQYKKVKDEITDRDHMLADSGIPAAYHHKNKGGNQGNPADQTENDRVSSSPPTLKPFNDVCNGQYRTDQQPHDQSLPVRAGFEVFLIIIHKNPPRK